METKGFELRDCHLQKISPTLILSFLASLAPTLYQSQVLNIPLYLFLFTAHRNRFEAFVNRLPKRISVDFLHFFLVRISRFHTEVSRRFARNKLFIRRQIIQSDLHLHMAPFSFGHRSSGKLLVSINQNNDRLYGWPRAIDVIPAKTLDFLSMLDCNGRGMLGIAFRSRQGRDFHLTPETFLLLSTISIRWI